MTSPQSRPPEGPGGAARARGRHRSEPVAPPPYGAPPPQRAEPERFNGFVPNSGNQAPPPQAAPSGWDAPAAGPGRAPQVGDGYRSLADMAAGPAPTTPPPVPEALRGLGTPPAPPATTGRWTRRRVTVLGVVAVLVIAVLSVGGVLGYRWLAPYYGLGYVSGRSVTVDGVKVTTDSVRCGLDTAPFGNSGTPHGVYCAITIGARNTGDSVASIDLRTWTADLDVGLTGVTPVGDWLAFRNELVEPHGSATYNLAYDIPRGARLDRLHFVIGDKTGAVATT